MNDLLTIFKALSEETRLRIITLLERGELCVCDLVAALNMSQPKVSFHLNVLKEAGLLKDRRQGRWTHYCIDDSDFFRRYLLMSVLERIPQEDLTADRKRLEEFMQDKPVRDNVVPLQEKKRCAGRCR